MKWYYAIRCLAGSPVYYRKLMGGGSWWFALCKHCHHQKEVHEDY